MNATVNLLRRFAASLSCACVVANALDLSPSLRGARQASELLAADSGASQ
jgi:hypothetical protein